MRTRHRRRSSDNLIVVLARIAGGLTGAMLALVVLALFIAAWIAMFGAGGFAP